MTPRQRITAAFTVPIARMTLTRLLALVGGLIVAVGGLAGAGRWIGNLETKPHADSTYVRRDTFAIIQAGKARRYSVDSVARDARDARIDTALNVLVRACRHRGDCP